MSEYTIPELAAGTLIGKVDEYGKAWHGAGHFMGFVPIEEARKLLTVNVVLDTPIVLNGDASRFRAVVDADTGYVFQVASKIYAPPSYTQVLLDDVETILDVSAGSLQIGSVIALGHKEKAIVQIRPTEGITVGGDMLLPWICAFSSLDSSWTTSYKGVETRVVCDNTAETARGERGGKGMYSRKNTIHNRLNVEKAREAVRIFFEGFQSRAKEVEQLMGTKVTEAEFDRVMAILSKRPNTRSAIKGLYVSDPRVAPWAGTSWGVLQAVNTFHHHYGIVRNEKAGVIRHHQQAINLVEGVTQQTDTATLRVLAEVLA